jgi:hypothetical protein
VGSTPGLSVCQSAQWAVGDFTEALAQEVAPPGMTEDAYAPLTYDLTFAAVQTLFPSQSRHDASPKMGSHHGTHQTGDGWKASGMARQSPRWRRLTSMSSRTGPRIILTGGQTYARTGREMAGLGAEPSPAECFPFEVARGEGIGYQKTTRGGVAFREWGLFSHKDVQRNWNKP